MNIATRLNNFLFGRRPVWWSAGFFVALVMCIWFTGLTLGPDGVDLSEWAVLVFGVGLPLYALDALLWWALGGILSDGDDS